MNFIKFHHIFILCAERNRVWWRGITGQLNTSCSTTAQLAQSVEHETLKYVLVSIVIATLFHGSNNYFSWHFFFEKWNTIFVLRTVEGTKKKKYTLKIIKYREPYNLIWPIAVSCLKKDCLSFSCLFILLMWNKFFKIESEHFMQLRNEKNLYFQFINFIYHLSNQDLKNCIVVIQYKRNIKFINSIFFSEAFPHNKV